jgi:hypothetical protein
VALIYSIKGFRNVQLNEKCRNFLAMQIFDHLVDKNEVIMNTPLYDEGILVIANNLVHLWGQPVG